MLGSSQKAPFIRNVHASGQASGHMVTRTERATVPMGTSDELQWASIGDADPIFSFFSRYSTGPERIYQDQPKVTTLELSKTMH